jgi:endonuclease/exonuclease/phosphatase (EEP) superfamily protein YafD
MVMPKRYWNSLKKINKKKLLFLMLTFQYQSIRADYVVPSPEKVLTNIGETKKHELDPKSIKILIWNVYKGQRQNFENHFLDLARTKDILVIQEMYLDQRMLSLLQKLSDFYFVGATSFLDSNIPTGVLTGSLGHLKDSKYLKSEFSEPITKTPKMSLLNSYAVRGFKKPLLIVNTHAINFVTMVEYEHQIQDLFIKITEYAGPVIFAGDFNTWSLGRMEILKKYIKQLKFNEVKFEKDERLKVLGNPLDHIFYSQGVKLIRAQVHGERDGSDHKAMDVEFLLEHP